jgi:hypothetical protein
VLTGAPSTADGMQAAFVAERIGKDAPNGEVFLQDLWGEGEVH